MAIDLTPISDFTIVPNYSVFLYVSEIADFNIDGYSNSRSYDATAADVCMTTYVSLRMNYS